MQFWFLQVQCLIFSRLFQITAANSRLKRFSCGFDRAGYALFKPLSKVEHRVQGHIFFFTSMFSIEYSTASLASEI